MTKRIIAALLVLCTLSLCLVSCGGDDGKAVITKAEGELEASKNLAEAASTLSNAPGALHLRTLSTINDVSSDQSNTIIFALPIEVLRAFEGKGVKNVVDMINNKDNK